MDKYGELAAGNGWTATRTTVMGLPCTVWQRGDEIAVYLPEPEGSPPDRAVALFNGRVLDGLHLLEAHLISSPRKELLTQHIEADKEGIIAHLAAMSAERKIGRRTATTQREARRLSDESDGIDLAISVLQAWEQS